MEIFQKHYHSVVQLDLVLTENLITASTLPVLKKVVLCSGGNSVDDNHVVVTLSGLRVVSGQTPYLTQQQKNKHKNISSSDVVGGKVTLRRSQMYGFLHKFLLEVLPNIKQFEGLQAPAHDKIYCFVLKDMFAFQELVPLFPFFENLGSLQCQFHFTTKKKAESVVLGTSLQLCYLPSDK